MQVAAPVAELDFRTFTEGDAGERRAFAEALADSLQHTGFLYLRNHGIASGVVARGFGSFPQFFVELPEETRLRYHFPEVGRQWGYTPRGIETGEHAKVPDEKHFWHAPEGHLVAVPEAPDFTESCETLFHEFHRIYRTLMRAVALSLGLEERYFDEQTGDSLLRVLHYPAQENPVREDERVEATTPGGNVAGMCASRHTDINMLTLLLARQAGLQLFHEGQWMPMQISDPNVLIVNCGDMLQHLTGGRFRSGEHRVVCEPGRERYSMPFFGHLGAEASIRPLEHLGQSDRERYPYMTAGEFLSVRLKQIGLLS
jgi:isopenicillin N synthase-like dioxygenase